MIALQSKIGKKVNVLFFLVTLVFCIGVLWFLTQLTEDEIYSQSTRIILIVVFWGVTLLGVRLMVKNYLILPLRKIKEVTRQASLGDLTSKVGYRNDDEIGQIARDLDRTIENNLRLVTFLEKIGEGNFTVEHEVLSEHDKLGKSLNVMRDKLQKINKEDDRRAWTSEGLTFFGEILRRETDSLEELSNVFLKNVVKYLNANQGGVFLSDTLEGREVLKKMSVYAWGRKKYENGIVELGEGLIGQVALEQTLIYITDVPEDFIRITSGLGEALPRCVLIIPILNDGELFGVLELASFQRLEDHEISFMEKICEILGSTLARIKVNERSHQLLQDSQKLTEELRVREEELRQNLTEMESTQQEMERKDIEQKGILSAMNNTLVTAEFDMNGNLLVANENFLFLLGYSQEEVIGESDRMFRDKAHEPIEKYKEFWNVINDKKLQKGDYKRLTKEGREIWLSASYTPALDACGKPYKVIFLGQDITEKKRSELESERQGFELRVQGEKLRKYTTELEDVKASLSQKLEEASTDLKKQIKDIEAEKTKNQAILEGCVDGVLTFNQHGEVEFFNRAAEEVFGLPRERVLFKDVTDVLPLIIEREGRQFNIVCASNGERKKLEIRTEVNVPDRQGSPLDLLLTLTQARVGEDVTFTIFVQKISVDLF